MSGPVTTHMGQEIAEQPAALRATIDALLPRADEVKSLARQTRQVLFIARGTSDNAAVYGSYLIQAFGERLTTLAQPSIATTYRPGWTCLACWPSRCRSPARPRRSSRH